MNSFSKGVGAAAVLAVLALTGCSSSGQAPAAAPVPLAAKAEPTPVTSFHAAQAGKSGDDLQTGWVQDGKNVQMSLSGPDNCLPQVDHITDSGGVISVYLKSIPDTCSNNVIAAYTTIEDAPNTTKVDVYQYGYVTPFELRKGN